MIALVADSPIFQRFARELDAEAPIDLGDARPDLSRATPEDIEHAQLAWAHRILGEYRGAVIVSELASVLLELGAPYPALAAVQRIVGDELRHTRLCAMVLDWLGGSEAFEVDLAGQRMGRREGPAAVRALEIVARELCLVEGESVQALTAHVRAAEDPAIRSVFESLRRDEVRHAAAGRALRALIERSYPSAELAAAQAALGPRLEDERRHLREQALARAVGGPGRALGARLRREDLERAYAEADAQA
jgi:hypothetical protein